MRSGGRPPMTWRRVWLGSSSFGIDLSSASVYGIRMLANSVARGRLLDDLAGVHHRDLVGATGDDAEVVGDEDHRHVALALLVGEQVEDLRLHGDVERGGGLVGEEQLRAAGQRDGDGDALAHAAGELVRVLVEAPLGLGDADGVEELERLLVRLVLGDVEVVAEGLGDLPADLHHRVERGHRVLEDHRHLGAPDGSQLVLRCADELLALVGDRPGADDVLGGEQAHDRAGQHGLARAGLADDAERLAALEAEGDTVDGLDDARLGVEVRPEVVDDEERAFLRGSVR